MVVKDLYKPNRTDLQRLRRATQRLNDENRVRSIWKEFVSQVGIVVGVLAIVYFAYRIFDAF